MTVVTPVVDVAPRAETAERILEWSVNPWTDAPRRALLGAALALGGCLLVLSLRESFVLSAALCIAAAASFSPLFAPCRCRLDAQGGSRSGTLGRARRSWSEVRRASATRHGVLLSPYREPHWLDATRALFLPFPVGDAHALELAARRHIEDHAAAR